MSDVADPLRPVAFVRLSESQRRRLLFARPLPASIICVIAFLHVDRLADRRLPGTWRTRFGLPSPIGGA